MTMCICISCGIEWYMSGEYDVGKGYVASCFSLIIASDIALNS